MDGETTGLHPQCGNVFYRYVVYRERGGSKVKVQMFELIALTTERLGHVSQLSGKN